MSGTAKDSERHNSPLWHVPEPRSAWFTGREATLLELRERLATDRVAALTQDHTDFARGGMGKTATAREYVHQQRGRYKHVLWLQAYSEFDLRAGLIELADRLNWPDRLDADLFRSMRRWLSEEQDWLLVLDEVRQPEIVAQLIPRSHAGHVLVTSRRDDLRVLGVEKALRLTRWNSCCGAPDGMTANLPRQKQPVNSPTN